MAGTGGATTGGGVEEDPIPASHFYLELDKFKSTIFFREITGIGSTTEVIQYKGARKGDFHSIQMVPGRLAWTEVVCKRGMTSAMDPWEWRKKVEDGKVLDARTNCSVVAVGQDGTEVARWNFIRAWPSAITGPVFDAKSNEVGVEELKFTHEGMIRVK
jgi:phage tail-like protein